MRPRAFAVEHRPAELLLEQLDRARQRGLRNVAPLRRAGEIQLLRDRYKIADLMHFHRSCPAASRRRRAEAFCLPQAEPSPRPESRAGARRWRARRTI